MKHKSIARGIANEYRFPGQDDQDVHQEALIGLWIACANWNPARGPFPPFARLVIHRRLTTILKAALAKKQMLLTDAAREDVLLTDGHDTERVVIARDALRRLCEAARKLTPTERASLAGLLNGDPLTGKSDDNGRLRARRKLEQEALF